MKLGSIIHSIRSLVFWGLILATASSFIFNLLFFLYPGLTGDVLQHLSLNEGYAYGQWQTMIGAILIFSIFIFAFSFPSTRADWHNIGIYEAFLIALFTEMYGFPLTIYVLTSLLGVTLSFGHIDGHLLAVFISRSGIMDISRAWTFVMWLSSLLLLLGFILIKEGWKHVYRSNGRLVTGGIYARIRHPQYLGFLIITTAFLIQWPTIPTVLMWPILVVMYYRLAKREEMNLLELFGVQYNEYMNEVTMFLPNFLSKKHGTSRNEL